MKSARREAVIDFQSEGWVPGRPTPSSVCQQPAMRAASSSLTSCHTCRRAAGKAHQRLPPGMSRSIPMQMPKAGSESAACAVASGTALWAGEAQDTPQQMRERIATAAGSAWTSEVRKMRASCG